MASRPLSSHESTLPWLVIHGLVDRDFEANRGLLEAVAQAVVDVAPAHDVAVTRIDVWPDLEAAPERAAKPRYVMRIGVSDPDGRWLEYWEGASAAVEDLASNSREDERQFLTERVGIAVEQLR